MEKYFICFEHNNGDQHLTCIMCRFSTLQS